MWPAGAIRARSSGSENLPHLIRQAVTAERAKFDMVFLADGLTSSEDGHPSQIARFEPLMVLTAFAHRDQPDRARRHRLDHLRRAVPSRARLRLARSHQPRPRRLERGDHVLRLDRRELRRSSIPRTPTATPSPRSSSTWCAALWDSWDDGAFPKDKATGVYVDQSKRHVLDHKGTVFLGEGAAQHLAAAAGPSDHRAVRLVGARPAARGAHRRRGVHRASEPRKRAGVLSRAERAARGVRAQAGAACHHAGLPAGAGRHREGGARQARAAGQLDRPEQGRAHAVRPAGPRRLAATISTGRCRNCRRPSSCRAAPSSSPTPRGATTSRCASSPRWSRPAAATT